MSNKSPPNGKIYTHDDIKEQRFPNMMDRYSCPTCDNIIFWGPSTCNCNACNKFICDDCLIKEKNLCSLCYYQYYDSEQSDADETSNAYDSQNNSEDEPKTNSESNSEVDYGTDDSDFDKNVLKNRADSPVEIASTDKEACTICLINKKSYAYMPCGHMALCNVCKNTILDNNLEKKCVVCKCDFKTINKIFF